MKCSRLVLLLLFLFSYSYSGNRIIFLEPSPGANLVSVKNNIIIGFENPIVLSETEILQNISVTGSLSMNHAGNLIICEDGKKILFNPLNQFVPGEKISVKLTGDLVKTLYTKQKEYSYSFTASGKSIEWDPMKSFKDEVKTGRKPIMNNDVPPAFPPLVVNIDNNPAPGYIFLSNYTFQSYPAYLIIANNQGIPYWYNQINTDCDDFKEQPNGNLTYYDVGVGEHIELDVNYTPIHSYYCGNGYATDGHELRVLGNGHAYVMAYDPEIVDMSLIVPGGDTNATVVGLIIQEVDLNNTVVFQWRSWDHFQITDAWHQNMISSYIDCVHGNAIEIDNDNNLLLSSRHLDEITKINRSTGDIMWRFGGKNNQFTFLGNDTLKFTYQHAVRRIANGNLTLFDNGNFHTPHFSRAVEYSMDELNKTATEVWEYRHTPDIYGSAMGYVQRLQNGNTFICWGYTNPNITEVSPTGAVVFEMTLPAGDVTYRAYKQDWNGNPLGIRNNEGNSPSVFKLDQNYPNPFNPTTEIIYRIAKYGGVKLSIYDILGREVQDLVNENQNPGTYKIDWNAANYPSGVYFYKLQAGDFTQTRKMTLVK